MSRRGDRRGDHSTIRVKAAGRIEDVIVCYWGKLEVGTIKEIENFKPELGVEGLGNFPERIVLEQRRIQVYQAWPTQDVAPHVTPEIETLRFSALSGIAIRRVKGIGWSSGYREAVGIEVVVGVP